MKNSVIVAETRDQAIQFCISNPGVILTLTNEYGMSWEGDDMVFWYDEYHHEELYRYGINDKGWRVASWSPIQPRFYRKKIGGI